MATSFVGLIGDPVAHSRSPAMHNAAFAHLGLSIRYELWHTAAAVLPARLEALRGPLFLGANITLPHKQAVMGLLDVLEPEAEQIGAVNTIYKWDDGSLVGANTDAPGLLADLREAGNFDPAGQRVVILGASGAARAAAFALSNARIAHLVIANRTADRAHGLAFDAGLPLAQEQRAACALDAPELPDYLAACGLLINATSVGWHDEETPLADVGVSAGALVYDMVYRPTRLLREGAARGARTLDGRGMLLYQGALAFSRWTGREPPLAVMRAALQL
jgi:shikimate dehydrogenase